MNLFNLLFLIVCLFKSSFHLYAGGNEPQVTEVMASKSDIEIMVKEMVSNAMKEPIIYKLWSYKWLIAGGVFATYAAKKILAGNRELSRFSDGAIAEANKSKTELIKDIKITDEDATTCATEFLVIKDNIRDLILNCTDSALIEKVLNDIDREYTQLSAGFDDVINNVDKNLDAKFKKNNSEIIHQFSQFNERIKQNETTQKKQIDFLGNRIKNDWSLVGVKLDSIENNLNFSSDVQRLTIQFLESRLEMLKKQIHNEKDHVNYATRLNELNYIEAELKTLKNQSKFDEEETRGRALIISKKPNKREVSATPVMKHSKQPQTMFSINANAFKNGTDSINSSQISHSSYNFGSNPPSVIENGNSTTIGLD